MRKSISFVIAACALLLAGGAYLLLESPISATGRTIVLPVDPVRLVAETPKGSKSFTIEIADESHERASGLMFRESMEDDHGMLFIFGQTQMVAFWMKDTPMPLDLVFVSQDGRVRYVKQGEPFSEAVISPSVPVRYVLELKAGTADREGIVDGVMLRHPAIGG